MFLLSEKVLPIDFSHFRRNQVCSESDARFASSTKFLKGTFGLRFYLKSKTNEKSAIRHFFTFEIFYHIHMFSRSFDGHFCRDWMVIDNPSSFWAGESSQSVKKKIWNKCFKLLFDNFWVFWKKWKTILLTTFCKKVQNEK